MGSPISEGKGGERGRRENIRGRVKGGTGSASVEGDLQPYEAGDDKR